MQKSEQRDLTVTSIIPTARYTSENTSNQTVQSSRPLQVGSPCYTSRSRRFKLKSGICTHMMTSKRRLPLECLPSNRPESPIIFLKERKRQLTTIIFNNLRLFFRLALAQLGHRHLWTVMASKIKLSARDIKRRNGGVPWEEPLGSDSASMPESLKASSTW